MHFVARSSFALALTLSLAGCPADPAVPANVPFADLPSVLAPQICAIYLDCGNPLVGAIYGTGADCANTLGARFEDTEFDDLAGAIAGGTIAYHDDLVDDCIGDLQRAGCAISNPFETCEAIFEGLVADGGACELNEECGPSSFCSISGVCPGTCQARAAAGATCSGSGSCVPGLECASGMCRAAATAGAACNGTTGVTCSGLEFSCVGDEGTTAGACTPWDTLFSGAVGELCDARNDDYCDAALSCALDGTSFRCVARAAAGGACTIALPDMCPAGQYCTGVNLSVAPPITTGTCSALPTAGQPCGVTATFAICASGLVCVPGALGAAGTCEILTRIGGTCSSSTMCASNTCASGTCVSGPPPGCGTP